jgi:hypothetical protein
VQPINPEVKKIIQRDSSVNLKSFKGNIGSVLREYEIGSELKMNSIARVTTIAIFL